MPLSVLVVDDHASMRDLFRICLALEEDLRLVALASDGDAAISAAAASQPDVIVLDHEMPIQDGIAILPALRAAVPGVRVVLFTASNDEATIARAFAAGATAYLVKDEADISDVLSAVRAGVPPRSMSA